MKDFPLYCMLHGRTVMGWEEEDMDKAMLYPCASWRIDALLVEDTVEWLQLLCLMGKAICNRG